VHEALRTQLSAAGASAVSILYGGSVKASNAVALFGMPDIDGAGLWREVVPRHPQLARRMLFVTGDTLSPEAGEFLRHSHCPSLDKPFSKADLLAKLAELLA